MSRSWQGRLGPGALLAWPDVGSDARTADARTADARAIDGSGRVLSVRDVHYAYGDRLALDAVSLDIPAGVLMGVLGPNGAGKTTLLRILLGVVPPMGGTISWGGRPVSSTDRQRWGYMPQERGLYPGMAAGEQVIFFGRLHGLSRADAARRGMELMAGLGLADRWADRTDKLSGGMQQRLQLATALMGDPQVIVLDEPFAGLDPVAVADLSTVLAARAEAGCTVLFSSHQLDLVQDLCESITMIDQGRVVLGGRVAELRSAHGRRQLRLHVDSPDRTWLAVFPGVRVAEERAEGLRLEIPPGLDPLAVLDAARAAGPVLDFGLELPSLSQLFLAAVAGGRAEDTEVVAGGRAEDTASVSAVPPRPEREGR